MMSFRTHSACRRDPHPERGRDPRDEDPRVLEGVSSYLDRRCRGQEADLGQAETWDRFYRDHAPFIRAIVRAYCDRSVDREDAAQEVWSALLARLGGHRHDGSRGRFHAWLFVVARNRLSDLGRHAARRTIARFTPDVESTLAANDESAEEILDRDLARGLIQEVLSELRADVSEASYRVIQLRWIEDRTVAEVAAILGLTASQVRSRQHRMMGRLRDLTARREGQGRHIAGDS